MVSGKLEKFLEPLNKQHMKIKLAVEKEWNNQVSFLDVLVYKKGLV